MLRKVATTLVGIALLAQTAAAQNVDIELKLLVDVSGSVSAGEYNLQKQGYVDAFNNGPLWTAFASSSRTLAVSYSEWSSSAVLRTNWVTVTDAVSAASFATVLSGLTRAGGIGSQTHLGTAMNFGLAELAANTFTGTRKIIDISGDGCENGGDEVLGALGSRQAAIDAGVVVNGLAIGSGTATCYGTYVTPNGFVESATSFDDFDDAIIRKIGREVGVNVPEPSTLALLGVGLFGLVSVSRRRKA